MDIKDFREATVSFNGDIKADGKQFDETKTYRVMFEAGWLHLVDPDAADAVYSLPASSIRMVKRTATRSGAKHGWG